MNGYVMLHKAWNSKGEMPFCVPRSSIIFQGHTVQNITDFDPNWALPDYRPVAAFKSLRFALLHNGLALCISTGDYIAKDPEGLDSDRWISLRFSHNTSSAGFTVCDVVEIPQSRIATATSRPPVQDIRDTVNPRRGFDQLAMLTSYRVWD